MSASDRRISSSRKYAFSTGVFHGSKYPVEHFMNAPAIHVGTFGAAAIVSTGKWTGSQIPDTSWEAPEEDFELNNLKRAHGGAYKVLGLGSDDESVRANIHPFKFSRSARFQKLIVPDDVANAAHFNLLEDLGDKHKQTVGASAASGFESPLFEHTYNQLRSGKIIPYRNSVESRSHMMTDPKNPSYDPTDTSNRRYAPEVSFVVPNPRLNLEQFKDHR